MDEESEQTNEDIPHPSNRNLSISLTSPIGEASFFLTSMSAENTEDDCYQSGPVAENKEGNNTITPTSAAMHTSGLSEDVMVNDSEDENEDEQLHDSEHHDRIGSQRNDESSSPTRHSDDEAAKDDSKSKEPPSVTSGTSSSSTNTTGTSASAQPAARKAPSPSPLPTIADKSEMNVFFENARYFMIKSANYENVSLARARGVWATLPGNERKLNTAFRSCANVLLIFSVKESGRFQGIARLSAPSSRSHPAVHWVLPFGMTSDSLSGTFELDWLTRRELSFNDTARIYNKLNEGKPVKIGRDGQEIDAESGLTLCRMFPFDDTLDLEDALRHSRDWRRRQQIRPDDGSGDGGGSRPIAAHTPNKNTRYQGRGGGGGGRYQSDDRGGHSGFRDSNRFGGHTNSPRRGGGHYDRSEDLRSTFDHSRRDNRSRNEDDYRRRYEDDDRDQGGRSSRHGYRERSRRDLSRSRSRSYSRGGYDDDEDSRGHRKSTHRASYGGEYSSSSSDSRTESHNSAALSALLADAAAAAEAMRTSALTNPLAAVLAQAALTTPTGLPPLPLLQQLFPMIPPPLPTLPMMAAVGQQPSDRAGPMSSVAAEASNRDHSDESNHDEVNDEQHGNEVDQFLKRMSRRNVVGGKS